MWSKRTFPKQKQHVNKFARFGLVREKTELTKFGSIYNFPC